MTTIHNKINKQDLLDDILYVYKTRGDNKFKIKYYTTVGKYSEAPIRTNGGWNNILTELGITTNNNKNVTKESAIEDFIKFKKEYGSIKSTLYRKHGRYSQIVIDKLFGNFTNFVLASGFMPERIIKTLSNEQVLSYLKDIYDEFGYINSTLITHEAPFTYQTVLNRFGLMANVYELLNIDNDVNSKNYFSSVDKVLDIFSEILKEKPIKEWTCKDLRNPEDTNNLYVDGYYPEHNLIVEYDGQQHYEYVEFLHKSYDKFERTQMLDKHKDTIIKDLGINLIRIRYDDPKTKEFVMNKIKVTQS